ncbi:RagB/SusD family nutrient uptake outer membrane protein [Rufibacter sp. LB8]|uniref:RagB/SusD family nutrient uptake outer membrane protein n=1 Tax=Rufibacter sp. LB8 TaxID=2777781 RepID=UPI00178C40A7|nr:RagB/SusD family nutrient uptake outer membrane protein [Rufibacter sp. LB8]
MKRVFLYTFAAATLVFSGCENDLDIENPNSATIESFWKTSADAELGVNAIYSTLHRGGPSRWLPFLTVIRSDEGLSNSPGAGGALANAMDKFIQPDYNFGDVVAVWYDMYVGINRANQVLDNVPAIAMNEPLKQRLLGEAKFMRAFYYYHLASLWGNVPLMLSTPKPTDMPPTSPQAVVWAQVEKDLSEAAAALPAVYPNDADLGRATKGAAYALLAKTYMQQKKYAQALPPLKWLVEEDGRNIYGLMEDYRDNFLINRENNKESVFEIQFAENPTENHDDDTDPRTDQLNYGTSIAQFWAPSGIGWSDGEAHRWVTREFLQERTTMDTRDPRLEASFIYDSTDARGPSFSMVYGRTFRSRFGSNNKRVWFRKFQNDHWKDVEGYRSPNNWRFIRYSDVLLMYAEAINATSGPATAYQYVDRVRQRAKLQPLSTAMPGLDQLRFLNQLKHERITELSGEGHRWNDLARWGDLGPLLAPRDPGFANFQVGKHEFLPIPQLDLDINQNLDQNPNW